MEVSEGPMTDTQEYPIRHWIRLSALVCRRGSGEAVANGWLHSPSGQLASRWMDPTRPRTGTSRLGIESSAASRLSPRLQSMLG